MDDVNDWDNENNVEFKTEQFVNRWDERKLDRDIPFNHEPQVLTDLISNGYKSKYVASALPITTTQASPLSFGEYFLLPIYVP